MLHLTTLLVKSDSKTMYLGFTCTWRREMEKKGPVGKLHPIWSPKKAVERQTDREGDTEVETDVGDRDLGSRDKDGKAGRDVIQENIDCLLSRSQELPQSQSSFQEGPAEGTIASFCPREYCMEGWTRGSTPGLFDSNTHSCLTHIPVQVTYRGPD